METSYEMLKGRGDIARKAQEMGETT